MGSSVLINCAWYKQAVPANGAGKALRYARILPFWSAFAWLIDLTEFPKLVYPSVGTDQDCRLGIT